MNADHSRRTFLLGGLATGAVLLAGKTFLHPSAAHAATEAVTLDACVNMTPGEMADRSQYVMAAWKYLQDAAAESDILVFCSIPETGHHEEPGPAAGRK